MLDTTANAAATDSERKLIELVGELLSLGHQMVDTGSRAERLALWDKMEESLRAALSDEPEPAEPPK